MRKPWTDEEIAKARKMLANGVSRYEIDRYFGRGRNATWQALAIRDDPTYRKSRVDYLRNYRKLTSPLSLSTQEEGK
jgi:hypothetical protein